MEPAKQAKIMQEFQRQSAQMDMTVSSHKFCDNVNFEYVRSWLRPLAAFKSDPGSYVYALYVVMFMNANLHYIDSIMRILVWQTEMMSDAIDDALDDDEAEEETEELTSQVLSYGISGEG